MAGIAERWWPPQSGSSWSPVPAVVAYNIFQGAVRRTLGRVDAMAHLILAPVA